MQPTMILLSLVILIAAAYGDYNTAMGTPSDYVYPNYALRYVSLGDYKQMANQGTYTTPDQQGYIRYITYTTDGTNIYRTIIRMKPGSYPATWPRLVSATQSAEDRPNEDVQQRIADGGESHPSEDTAPPTSTTLTEDNLPQTTREESGMTTTIVPYPEEYNRGVEKEATRIENDEESPSIKEETINAISAGNDELNGNDLNGNDLAAEDAKIVPQYLASPYGTIALYPIGYNSYARRQLIRPMGGASMIQHPSASPTVAAFADKNPTTASIQTIAPTMRPSMAGAGVPTLRPSSVPIGYTTSGSPLRISYVYPYMRYNTQNAVMYQVPQQQFKTSQQYVSWSGVPQPTYQATYPQGYMSYQPTVLALRSTSPLNQNIEPKMEPSMRSLENIEQ